MNAPLARFLLAHGASLSDHLIPMLGLSPADPRLAALARSPYSAALARFVAANNFSLQQANPLPGNRKGKDIYLVLGLTEEHRKAFGLDADAILLLALVRDHQEAWFRSEVDQLFQSIGPRLASHIVLILSPDGTISAKCRMATLESKSPPRSYVPLGVADLMKTEVQDSQRLLFSAFLDHGFAVDHFKVRNPVPDDLFGRHRLVARLEGDIRDLDHGLALLGTRRVGKTSVLQHILGRLATTSTPPWRLAFYDAQPDGSEARNLALAKLGESLGRSARAAGLAPPGKGSATSLDDLVMFVLRGDPHCRVMLAIDELEHIVPDANSPTTDEVEAFVRIFGTLRALKQKHGQRVCVFVCGTNETFCETPSFMRRPNPVASWFTTRYVTPLPPDAFSDMLVSLGRRMGISFRDIFLERTFEEFGGHPFLARQFCSVAIAERKRPLELDQEDFDAAIKRFERESATTYGMVLDQLRFFYPSEFDLLLRIAERPYVSVAAGSELSHLVSYGLVHETGDAYELTMRSLTRFLPIGASQIAYKRFRIVKSLGEGAQGMVSHAYDTDRGVYVATKIYSTQTDRSAVEAEYKLLLQASALGAGAFVVRPIEVAKHGESWALVMEYIEGRTLESVLHDGIRFPWDVLHAIATQLFDALDALLPRIEHDSATAALNARELAIVMQQGSHIYHRDLKPSNLMLTSDMRVRIVDFGVASAAQDASRTSVGTPSYMAPDVGLSEWDPSFDLFSLGRILLRCTLLELPETLPDDVVLRAHGMTPAASKAARVFFARALAGVARDRFQSVAEMRSAWDDFAVHVL